EAALRADRNDDGVLYLLRLDEPEHFGAEIYRPVRPAETAPRDRPETEMNAFDVRRIDEDFGIGARQGHFLDVAAVDLERQRRAGLSVLAGLEIIAAQRRKDRMAEGAQDLVLIEAYDILK